MSNLLFFIFGLITSTCFLPILENITSFVCQCCELLTAVVGTKVIKLNQENSGKKEETHVYGFSMPTLDSDEEEEVE